MNGSIKDRGNGSYLLSISSGYDTNGKQIRHYKTVKCKNKKEAKAKLLQFVLEVNGSDCCKGQDITFGDFCLIFEERHRKVVSEVTWSQYENFLRNRIKPCFGDRKIIKITAEDIMNFVNVIANTNSRLDRKDGAISHETAVKIYKLVKLICSKAVQWGYLDRSPCERISRDMLPKSDKKHNPILTEEDLGKLIKVIDTHKETRDFLQNKLCFYICLCTGTRRSEAGALTWDDINFDKNEMTISKALKTINGKTIGVGTTKNVSSNRILFFDEQLKELFLRHKQSQQQWLEEKGITNNQNLIFTSSIVSPDKDTTYFNPASCREWLRKLCKKNGIPEIGMHSLRAMCATLAASSGMPINLVSANLGHTNLTTTSIYVRDMQEMRREASNAFFCKLNSIKDSK